MTEENINQEEVIETTNEVEQEESNEEVSEDFDDKSDKLRDTVNIQNRILKKEGYEFIEGKWQKEDKPKEDAPTGTVTKDDLTKIQLRAEGYKSKEEQEIILSAMSRTGDSLDEILNDELITSRIEKLRNIAKTSEATPSSSRNRAGATDNVARLAKKYLETGERPTDRETRDKISAYLKNNSTDSIY